MTDDLVKLLRRPYGNLTFAEKEEAADRIEELEAKLAKAVERIKELEEELQETQDRANAFATKEYYTEMRAERAEAKLATCEKYRDAYAECDRIGTQKVRELEQRLAKAEEERERIGRELNMARYGQPDFAWSIHKEAMADLEAKLEKLIGGAGTVLEAWDHHMRDVVVPSALNDAIEEMRSDVEEAKGRSSII